MLHSAAPAPPIHPARQPARPETFRLSAHVRHDAVVVPVARTGCEQKAQARHHLRINSAFSFLGLLLRLREQNLACSARHAGEIRFFPRRPAACSRSRARGPPSFSNGAPACRCSMSGPSCRRAHSGRPLTLLAHLHQRCIAAAPPAFFINLQSLSPPRIFPVLASLAFFFGPSVARAAAAAFLAQG